MIRCSVRCLAVALGMAWLGCGGSEFSPQADGGTQTGSAGNGSSTGSSATGAGGAGGDVGTTSSTGSGGGTTIGSGGTTTGTTTGSGGAGGQSLDASPPDAPGMCAGTVTFRLTAGNGKSSDWCVGSQCVGTWVTVTTNAGKPVTFEQGCSRTCSTCMMVPCPPLACRLPQPMMAQGETTTWDGTDWQDGTCGAMMSCKGRQCAAPGHYVAKMCASRSTPDGGTFGQCSSSPMLTCVEVPFDYPTSAVVAGMVN